METLEDKLTFDKPETVYTINDTNQRDKFERNSTKRFAFKKMLRKASGQLEKDSSATQNLICFISSVHTIFQCGLFDRLGNLLYCNV